MIFPLPLVWNGGSSYEPHHSPVSVVLMRQRLGKKGIGLGLPLVGDGRAEAFAAGTGEPWCFLPPGRHTRGHFAQRNLKEALHLPRKLNCELLNCMERIFMITHSGVTIYSPPRDMYMEERLLS